MYSFERARKAQQKADDGIWMELIVEDDESFRKLGGEVRVSSPKRKSFQDHMDKVRKNYRRSKNLKPKVQIPDSDAVDLLLKEIPGRCLHDWRGIADQDGSPLAYSDELARTCLAELREFRDAVISAMARVDAAAEEELEAVSKNSVTSSDGLQGGQPSTSPQEY